MPLKVTIEKGFGRVVVTPYGKIDTTTSPEFAAALGEAMKQSTLVELNLAETQYISSSGIRVLMDTAKKLDEKGSFKLTHVGSAVMEVLDMTGLTDILDVEAEVADGSNVKVMFFDVDGTLLSHSTGTIPESAVRAIKEAQAKGIKAVIATGRDIVELDKLPIHDIDFDAYLTLNGNICLDSNRRMFAGNEIDPGEVEVLVGIFKAGRIPFVLVGKDKRYINYVDDVVIKTQIATHGTIPETGEYQGEKIYQCLAFVDAAVRQRLETLLDHCTITSWNDTGIDIIAKTGGKDAGIQKFLDREGFSRSQTMAFGDGENDKPMIRFADIGVAMGNGVEGLKAIADYVTTHIDDNGIENALKHFNIID